MIKKVLEKSKSNKWFLISLILAAVVVLYFGTGFAMKTTDNASFCGSCHVMHEAVRTHSQSVHAELSCNECHVPQPFPKKVVNKAYLGSKDIYKNLFTEIDDVIHTSELTKDIVNNNCSECHAMTNINVEVNMDAKQYCTDCHKQVPHFPKKPIGERRVAGE